MPDQRKLEEIICRMRSDYIPEHKAAADDYIREGFSTDTLLSIIENEQQPNLVSMYFYISGKRSDEEAKNAWLYLQRRFEEAPEEFITHTYSPFDLSDKNRYLLFSVRKYLITNKTNHVFLSYLESIKLQSEACIKKTLSQLDVALDSFDKEDFDYNARMTAYIRYAIEREIPQFNEIGEGNLTSAELDAASQITSLDVYTNCCRIKNVNVISLLLYRQWLLNFFLRASIKLKYWTGMQTQTIKKENLVRYAGYNMSLTNSILSDNSTRICTPPRTQILTTDEANTTIQKVRDLILNFSFDMYIAEAEKISEYPNIMRFYENRYSYCATPHKHPAMTQYGRPFFPDVPCPYYDAIDMLGKMAMRLPKKFPVYFMDTVQNALKESNDSSFRLEILSRIERVVLNLINDNLRTYKEELVSAFKYFYLEQTAYEVGYDFCFDEIVVYNSIEFYESFLLPYLTVEAFFDFESRREAQAYMAIDALLKARSVKAFIFIKELLKSKRAKELKPPTKNYWNFVLQQYFKEFNRPYKIKASPFVIGYKWEMLCQSICHHYYGNVLSNTEGTRLGNNKIPDITIGIPERDGSGRISHVERIIECKKSLYFAGLFDAINNEVTDKYINYCDTLEYWILEKPDTFKAPNYHKVEYIFAGELLDAQWLDISFKTEIQSLLIEAQSSRDSKPETIDELIYSIDQLLDIPSLQPEKRKGKKLFL